MVGRIIFITGGCRSGKSQYALDYANHRFHRKLYLATCQALDEEMAQRVKSHQRLRGPEWITIEEPLEIVGRIRDCADGVDLILLDCLTLWLSNLLMTGDNDEKITSQAEKLVHTLIEARPCVLIVSNEVGMGIVPVDPLSRRFRDLSGIIHQKIAQIADSVIFMVSGIPMFLKGAP